MLGLLPSPISAQWIFGGGAAVKAAAGAASLAVVAVGMLAPHPQPSAADLLTREPAATLPVAAAPLSRHAAHAPLGHRPARSAAPVVGLTTAGVPPAAPPPETAPAAPEPSPGAAPVPAPPPAPASDAVPVGDVSAADAPASATGDANPASAPAWGRGRAELSATPVVPPPPSAGAADEARALPAAADSAPNTGASSAPHSVGTPAPDGVGPPRTRGARGIPVARVPEAVEAD